MSKNYIIYDTTDKLNIKNITDMAVIHDNKVFANYRDFEDYITMEEKHKSYEIVAFADGYNLTIKK